MVSRPSPRRRLCYFRISTFFGRTDVQTFRNKVYRIGNGYPQRAIRRPLLLRPYESLRLRTVLYQHTAKGVLQRLLYGHAHVEDLPRRLACGRGGSNPLLQGRRTVGSISATQTQKILEIVKNSNCTKLTLKHPLYTTLTAF